MIAGQDVIVHGMTRLEAFDVATGETKWWVTISSTGTSSPVVYGDTIYVASWSPFGEADQVETLPNYEALLKNDKDANGTINRDEVPASLNVFSRPETPDVPGATYSIKAAFARFDTNKDGELQKEEWEAGLKLISSLKTEHGLLAVRLGGSGDVTATHVTWKEKASIPEVPTPLAYQNRIYLIRNGGILTCMDAATGQSRIPRPRRRPWSLFLLTCGRQRPRDRSIGRRRCFCAGHRRPSRNSREERPRGGHLCNAGCRWRRALCPDGLQPVRVRPEIDIQQPCRLRSNLNLSVAHTHQERYSLSPKRERDRGQRSGGRRNARPVATSQDVSGPKAPRSCLGSGRDCSASAYPSPHTKLVAHFGEPHPWCGGHYPQA